MTLSLNIYMHHMYLNHPNTNMCESNQLLGVIFM